MADGILGLLGAGVDKIQGLLSNPLLQGVALTAATGANPLLGLIAGPIIKNSREQKTLENDLLRQSLLDAKRRSTAQQGLASLIQQETHVPVSAPIGLMNVEGGGESLIPATRRQAVPTISTPGGQRDLVGLLGQLAPAQVASSLLSQSTANPPTSIAELDALGLPRTPEGFARLQQIKNTLSPTDQANLLLTRAQIEALQNKNQEEADAAAAARRQEKFSIQDTLKQGRNILKLTERLEGTFLEPGRVGNDFRRPFTSLLAEAASFFGKEDFADRKRELVSDFDTFRKDSVNFVLSMADRFGTDLTNFQLEILQKANAGQDVSPAAIKSVVTDVMRRSLNEADAKDISVAEREAFEELLDGFSKGGETDDAPLTAAERAELEALRRRFGSAD